MSSIGGPVSRLLLLSVVGASLLSCACDSEQLPDGYRSRVEQGKNTARSSISVSGDGSHVNMISLMRGSGRSSAGMGGKWRTSGAITVTAVPGGDVVIITCAAQAGCSPESSNDNVTVHSADGHGLHGIFMDNITLTASTDFLFQALARAHLRPEPVVAKGKIIDAFALACPFVSAFTTASAGRGGDLSLLVGNCQAPIPADDSAATSDGHAADGTLPPARGGRLPSSSAFSSTPKQRTKYTMGLFFGPTSRAGDSFLLFDLRVLPMSPPASTHHLVPATGPDGLIPHGDEQPEAGRVGAGWAGWGPSHRPLLTCPRYLMVKDGRWGVNVQRMYDSTITKLNGSEAHPLHFYSYYARTTSEQWDHIVRRHVAGLDYKPG